MIPPSQQWINAIIPFMQFLFTLLNRLAYLNPLPLAGWLVWAGVAGLLASSLLSWRKYHRKFDQRAWWSLCALILFTPAAILFLGLEFSRATNPSLSDTQTARSTIMVFSALPWVLAGGALGPFAGAAVGILSGLVRGLWDTHTFFSILDLALLAAVFSASTRQRFRTPFFRLLRQPLFNVLSLTLIHTIFLIVGAFFSVSASTSERLAFALSNAGTASLSFGVEMLIAGFAAQILITIFPHLWGGDDSLQPSPAEANIGTRSVSSAGAIISILLILLLAGDWFAARSTARGLLKDRLAGVAQMSARAIPQFFETGQNLSTQIASDSRLTQVDDSDLQSVLGEKIQSTQFFSELAVVDVSTSAIVSIYPPAQSFQLTGPELTGLPLTLQGVLDQQLSIPPSAPGESARVSFIAAIPNTTRAILARTDIHSNVYLRPLIQSLDVVKEFDGIGMLIDERGDILFHSDSGMIFSQYAAQRSDSPELFDQTSADGIHQLAFYQPTEGHPWAVVLIVPAQQAHRMTINIALPIALMILLLGAIALVALRFAMDPITNSLHELASEAKYISTGKFDRPLATKGVDELSDIRNAFEHMRVNLQWHLDELNHLLTVSQSVASNRTLAGALRPILEALVASGASSARITLVHEAVPDEASLHFADGLEQDVYLHLDQQILALAEQQGRIVMATLTGTKSLIIDPNLPQPESLIALALRHDGRYLGVLWAAYNKQHIFTESDFKFISTLASQSALAVANTRLFRVVDANRLQLESILNSTPDPVLVTDASNRLVLANPAAGQVLGVTVRSNERVDVEKVIRIDGLTELLKSTSSELLMQEIAAPDERIYLAMSSLMTSDGKAAGRVCILRDVTQLKQFDRLKSDFVATVSHDLRSPLTLMRGYATMLEMAGELNDQQKNYAKMIVQGVDSMAKLVNNLLDLGRIDFGVGLQVEKISVLDVLERVTGELQMQAKQKNISLGVELPRDLPNVIEADHDLIQQALHNLVENAIKYTHEGGEVTIHLKALPSALIFAVEDSGIGITEEDRERLFEKFFRGTNREVLAQRGTGLGLAIVKSVAERHGGKVGVDSEPGKGSIFFMQIPTESTKETSPA